MRFGCCGCMISPSVDPIGVEIVESLADIGFDYIELSLWDIMALSDVAFSNLVGRVERSGIRCEACNNFFPPRVRLTGSEASLTVALDYAAKSMQRAARVGAQIIVFGSSGAKNVPEGFPIADAWKQLVELLWNLGTLAEQYGITVAIEPLNQKESNIINLASEGLRLAREVNHPSIRLLVDFYHLMTQRESPGIILEADSAICHLHFAKPEGRSFPTEPEDQFLRFFYNLREIRYSGRCSVEAYTHDFESDARHALQVLRELTSGSTE